jgi:hypothetical protein
MPAAQMFLKVTYYTRWEVFILNINRDKGVAWQERLWRFDGNGFIYPSYNLQINKAGITRFIYLLQCLVLK